MKYTNTQLEMIDLNDIEFVFITDFSSFQNFVRKDYEIYLF